jgi:hypothetical protein
LAHTDRLPNRDFNVNWVQPFEADCSTPVNSPVADRCTIDRVVDDGADLQHAAHVVRDATLDTTLVAGFQ